MLGTINFYFPLCPELFHFLEMFFRWWGHSRDKMIFFWWENDWKNNKIVSLLSFVSSSLDKMAIAHLYWSDVVAKKWPLSEAIIYFQSVLDGFCMTLCGHDVKMLIRVRGRNIDFIYYWAMADHVIKPLTTSIDGAPLNASACLPHKVHKNRRQKVFNGKYNLQQRSSGDT